MTSLLTCLFSPLVEDTFGTLDRLNWTRLSLALILLVASLGVAMNFEVVFLRSSSPQVVVVYRLRSGVPHRITTFPHTVKKRKYTRLEALDSPYPLPFILTCRVVMGYLVLVVVRCPRDTSYHLVTKVLQNPLPGIGPLKQNFRTTLVPAPPKTLIRLPALTFLMT